MEAQIAKFRKCIPSEDQRVSSKWVRYRVSKEEAWKSHLHTVTVWRERVTVCHCHVTSNYFQTQPFRFFIVFRLPLWHAMFEAVETISDFPCFKWAYENTFPALVSLRWSSILLGWQRTWRHWAMQMERSCDGDGLGPARDVERVESNTGGIMKRVRFVQFYAILQFGTMGSIFMNLVLDLDFLSMEVITCEPPLFGHVQKLDSNSPGCPSMLILFICRLSERKTCCTD